MGKHNYSRKSNLTKSYVSLMNFKCAHPECESGMDIEAHHIIPLSKGGADQYWNLISLCYVCHRTRKLHRRSDDVQTALHTWKFMQEMQILGFYLDEYEPNFEENLKKAILIRAKRDIDCPVKKEEMPKEEILPENIIGG